ncbi:hypothetical protein D3C72_2190740 [compost metagenome]
MNPLASSMVTGTSRWTMPPLGMRATSVWFLRTWLPLASTPKPPVESAPSAVA